LTIKEKDEVRLKKILIDIDCKYDIVRSFGFLNFIKNFWSRKGILTGLMISFILIFLVSDISFFVVDNDLNDVKDDRIIEIFKDYKKENYFFILNKNEENEIKNKIIALDGISNCEIEKKGLFLVIDIKNTLNESHYIDSSNVPITSKYDAIITKVICLNGTALVKRDQSVKVGQVLIDNKVTINEEIFDSNVNGEVYGRVFYHNRKLFNITSMEKVKTGNFISYNELEFFKIKTKNNKEIPFENYLIEEQKIKLFNLLPLTVNRYIIREYKNELISFEINDVKDTLTSLMVNEIKNEIKCDFKTLNANTIIKKVDNYYMIDVYLEVEQRIDN
jgi:sporulation protein YqfD